MLKYLGLDNLDDLPDVISKDQKQANEIETYLSKLNTEVEELREKKINLEKKIILLNNSKKNDKLEQTNFVGEIKEKTEIIRKKNEFFHKYGILPEHKIDYENKTIKIQSHFRRFLVMKRLYKLKKL